MHRIKILIVEDEILTSEFLSKFLIKSGYEITDVVDSGECAILSIDKSLPDIVIMDIKLSGELDGIQTSKALNKTINIPIIYLTKFSDNPTFKRAIQTNPASFLIKPFNEVALINSIELTLYNASCIKKNGQIKTELPKDLVFELSNFIFIKDIKRSFKVYISDIIYIQGDGSSSKIKTKDKDFSISHTLKKIEDQIQHPALVRIHRSFIVNLTKIDSITRRKFALLNLDEILDKTELAKRKILTQIPIGDDYKENLYKNLTFI